MIEMIGDLDLLESVFAVKDKRWPGIDSVHLMIFYCQDSVIEVDSYFGRPLGLTSDRFGSDSRLIKKDGHVFIAHLQSRSEGNFRALIESIMLVGLGVKIVTPAPDVKEVIKREGFIQTFEQVAEKGPVEVWAINIKLGHTFLIKNEASIVCLKCNKESFSAGDVKEVFCLDCNYHQDRSILFESRIQEATNEQV